MAKDVNESYWKNYNQLQHVKHQLLQKYLGAWFPILSSWHGRVLYVDCNAGRGRHEQGQPGSPILALETLLNHNRRDTILKTTEVSFVFFENDVNNYRQLQQEITALGRLPKNMSVFAYDQDYAVILTQRIQGLRASSQSLAPSFIFVDPFGFSLSMNLLNDLLEFY